MYRTKRDGVRVRILETGEEFNSIRACSYRLNVDPTWLGKVTRGNNGLCTCKGYHIIRIDDPRINFDVNKTEYRGRRSRAVQIIETGQIFDSISECAESIGGSAGTICEILSGRSNRVTHRGYHFEYVN